MKRLILAALAAALLSTPALARDVWNGSGAPLDHKTPADRWGPYLSGSWGSGSYSYPAPGRSNDPRVIHVPEGVTDREDFDFSEMQSQRAAREEHERAVAKAIQGQYECRPVVVYTDEGVFHHRALGCR
jgi:opacity protein-like surface antigen